MNAAWILARWEFSNAMRTRWVVAAGVAFGSCAAGVVVLGMRSTSDLGITGIGPAATNLLGLALLLPPLIGMLLGGGSIAGARERGTLHMVLTQPHARGALVAGTFLGLAGAVLVVLGIGLLGAALVVGSFGGAGDIRPLLGVAVASACAAVTAVALGVLVSTLSRTRSQATAWCVVLWFFFAIGADLLLISLVPALDIGPTGILFAMLLNPIETARTLALMIIDPQLSALGPFGAFLTWEFGTTTALLLIVGALGAWCAASTLGARALVQRLDL